MLKKRQLHELPYREIFNYGTVYDFDKKGIEWVYKNTRYESKDEDLIQELKNLGAKTSWYDPLVASYNNEYSTPLNPNIDLGLIISPHEQIDFSTWLSAGTKVFDLSANSNNYGWPKFLQV